MQEDGQKDDPSQPVGNNETGSDRDAVKKSMDDQSHQHRVSPVTVDERILMSFLAEVEVRRDRMFEQMDQKVSGENQEGALLPRSSRLAGRSLQSRSPA